MITEKEQQEFEGALKQWSDLALALALAESDYAAVYAKALISSPQSNDAKRQADAEQATTSTRHSRDRARVHEQAARWRVQWHLAAIGRRQPPA